MNQHQFIQWLRADTTRHPDGAVDVVDAPAVWTVAHRGHSGRGRLDLWSYPSQETALAEAAKLAMDAALDEDQVACELMQRGDHDAVLKRYEETSPPSHLLRVEPAWLQVDDRELRREHHEAGSAAAAAAIAQLGH